MTIGAKKIATNAFLLSLSSGINLAISVVTTSLIARSFGPELYGTYTFGLAYIMVFTVLANFGIESLFVREAAREPEHIKRLISNVVHLKIILAIGTVVIVDVSANLLGYPDRTVKVIYVLSIGLFFQIMSTTLMAVYRSQERMAVIAVFNVVFRVVTAVLILASIYFGIGLKGVVAAYTVGCFVVFVGNAIVFRRDYGRIGWKLDPSAWKDLIYRGRAFYVSALFGTIYLRINLFVLSKSVNELELGYFMAAWTLVETLYVFPEAVTGALFPAFSRIYGTAEEALGMVYSKMLKYILILSVAVCAGCLVVGDEILLLIYGPKFHDSIPILNVLIFLWAVGFLSNMMGWLLYAIKKETTHVKVMGAGCVVSLVLSIAFIEWFGTVGSAYALILSETFLVVSMAVVLHRSGLRSNLDGRLLRLALVVPAMVFAVRLMLDFNVVIQVMVGALVYAVSIYLFRVLDREELIALRRMIRR